jgi:transglutaminase-like putative cysteine protease/Mg-chelatase subunit ChlD
MVRNLFVHLSIILVSIQGFFADKAMAEDFRNPNAQIQIKSTELAIQQLIAEYVNRLGVFQDPFVFVYNGMQADQLFQRLCRRSVPSPQGASWEESSLGKIRKHLQIAFNGDYEASLVQTILEDARIQLSTSLTGRLDLQSNLLALKFTSEYLRRYLEPETVVDRDGQSNEAPEDSDPAITPNPPRSDQEDQNKQNKDSPEYPDLASEYKPFTKDTSSSSGSGQGSQKQYRIAEVNFKTPYFAQRYLSEVVRGASHPFREASVPGAFPLIGKFAQTERSLTIRTFGKTKVPLFVPPLFKPLQPSDPRAFIRRAPSGGYELELKSGLAELQTEIHIPLVEDQKISLSPPVRDFYSRPVGFASHEWPEKLQATIFRKFLPADAQTNSLGIAQALADYISNEHLYSVGAQPATDPTEALKAGSFQCDMASYAMVSILRDYYKIPSRVVGGYRAKTFQNGKDGKSYLIIPGEAHVWVEVFVEETSGVGHWVLYDPTPKKKDRKDNEKKEGEKDEYSTNSLKEPSTDPKKTGTPGEVPSVKDHLKEMEDATAKREKEHEAHTQESARSVELSKGLSQELSNALSQGLSQGLSNDELAGQLEIGSLELNPDVASHRNPLMERMIRIVLQAIVEPNQSSQDIQSRLNLFSSVIKNINSSELTSFLQEATRVHSTQHPDLKNWLDQIIAQAPTQDLNKTYQDLFLVRRAVEIYSQLLDPQGQVPVPHTLISSLLKLQTTLHSLAHTDSPDIALVQELVRALPPVATLLLKEQFDFTHVGPNVPTREIAKKLKAGELNDIRLLSKLTPLSDFMLGSSPRAESIEVKTWQKDSLHPRGRDLLPLERFSDLSRAILSQPGRGVEANIQNGTAYVLSRRKRMRIPAGYGKEEAERITIVLYDISGSMTGDPARFQAGLISAFTARAISDVSPSGLHRHRVVLVPFDDQVGTPFRVTQTQEALEVLNNARYLFHASGGGTDIQKALIQAMSLIADAEKRSGEPLAAANIILMTDGQASIDSDELLRARAAIDRQTPLQLMFIAINQTSEELMSFAMSSELVGAERGFYREFTSELIQEILFESEHLDLTQNQNSFYTDKLASDLPGSFFSELYKISGLAQSWSEQLKAGNEFLTPAEHLESLKRLKAGAPKIPNSPLEKWLIQVRKLVLSPAFLNDKRLFARVLNDLLIHFERISGVATTALNEHEQEQLKHLVRYAAGLEAGF